MTSDERRDTRRLLTERLRLYEQQMHEEGPSLITQKLAAKTQRQLLTLQEDEQ